MDGTDRQIMSKRLGIMSNREFLREHGSIPGALDGETGEYDADVRQYRKEDDEGEETGPEVGIVSSIGCSDRLSRLRKISPRLG